MYWSADGQNHLTCSLFYGKCWISHVIYWILYWRWKTESLRRYRTVAKCICCLPHGCVANWDLWLAATARHQERLLYFLLAWEKIQSEIELWFLLNVYLFYMIMKLKNHTLNHHKSGTFCICIVDIQQFDFSEEIGYYFRGISLPTLYHQASSTPKLCASTV